MEITPFNARYSRQVAEWTVKQPERGPAPIKSEELVFLGLYTVY